MDHAPDQHAHSHGQAHTHDHGHDHHGGGDYYLQQLLTIGICGAFGVVGLLMCFVSAGRGVTDNDGKQLTKLGVLLSPGFHIWVLIGSLVLLAITVIRGVALWKSVGATPRPHGHDHDHKPGEACDHPSHAHDHDAHDHKPGEACDHPAHSDDHAGHDHDHGDHSADDHSHGNIYWRVVVLLFPIVIYLMGLPDGTFSAEYQAKRVKDNEVGELIDVADKGKAGEVSFETLAAAAYSEPNRELFTGKTVTLSGQYKQLAETQFTLFFFKQTCCAADQVPLKATCVVKPEDKSLLQEVVTVNGQQVQRAIPDAQKVSVTGRIQYVQDPGGEWLTVLRVEKGGLKKR